MFHRERAAAPMGGFSWAWIWAGSASGSRSTTRRGHRARARHFAAQVAREQDLVRLSRIAVERRAAAFVAGLPFNMDGTEGPQAEFVRKFCEKLERTSGVKVHFQDERLTSVEAEERLKNAGWSLKKLLEEKRKGAVDRIAAVLLLEDYLAAHGGSGVKRLAFVVLACAFGVMGLLHWKVRVKTYGEFSGAGLRRHSAWDVVLEHRREADRGGRRQQPVAVPTGALDAARPTGAGGRVPVRRGGDAGSGLRAAGGGRCVLDRGARAGREQRFRHCRGGRAGGPWERRRLSWTRRARRS